MLQAGNHEEPNPPRFPTHSVDLAAVLDTSSMNPQTTEQSFSLVMGVTRVSAWGIEERIFRDYFGHAWNIAAAPCGDCDLAVLLAVDIDQRITRERGQTRMLRSQCGNQLRADRARETSKLIAIIDDDESICDSLRDLMESAGLEARCFGSAEEFLESGLHRQAACLITDILMPKMSVLELQTRLKDEECDIPIIFITAYGDARMRIQAMREGAVEFLAKPFDHQLLLKTVRAALDM